MKRRYMKLTVISLMLLFVLSGCGNAIPDMTEEEAQQIGEYAALTLLKYDANNRSRLVDISVIEAHDAKEQMMQELAEQAAQNKEPEGMKPVDDTPTIEKEEGAVAEPKLSFEDFYGLPDGVSVVYQGYNVCDSYVGDASDEFFALEASTGKQFLVLEFGILNQSESEQFIDLFSKTATYRVTVNDSKAQNALTTMLMNDISTYVDNIAAGDVADVVLLVEIEGALAGNISSISLNMKNESKTGTIQLQ